MRPTKSWKHAVADSITREPETLGDRIIKLATTIATLRTIPIDELKAEADADAANGDFTTATGDDYLFLCQAMDVVSHAIRKLSETGITVMPVEKSCCDNAAQSWLEGYDVVMHSRGCLTALSVKQQLRAPKPMLSLDDEAQLFKRLEHLTQAKRTDLHRAIIAAVESGMSKSEAARRSGYTREHVKAIMTAHQMESSDEPVPVDEILD